MEATAFLDGLSKTFGYGSIPTGVTMRNNNIDVKTVIRMKLKS